MKTSTIATGILLAATLSACGTADEEQLQNNAQPQADTSSATTFSTDSIPSGTYAVDRNHAYVTFSYLHLGYSYPQLRFTGIDGELDYDANAIADSSVAIAIDTNSIDTNIERFDRELQSLQYFNAEEHPTIAFTSHSFERSGSNTGTLSGDLTIKGRTRPVSLDVVLNNAIQHPMMNVPALGFSATGTLLRSDWGLSRNIPFVADEVTVKIEIEFLHGQSETSAAAAASATEINANASVESQG